MTSSAKQAKNIAVLGLGAGVMAAFLENGQEMDFYELDPDNIWLAKEHFSYLKTSKGKVKIICGDGRLQLRNATQSYDLIFMDAFSSDSIPIHLLTIEAIKEYFIRLKEDGCILFHISNRHLNLLPILTKAAQKLGMVGKFAINYENEKNNIYPTRWFSISSEKGHQKYIKSSPDWKDPILKKASRYWTDDFSSMLDAFPPDPELFIRPVEPSKE
jgi:spermidine synthase